MFTWAPAASVASEARTNRDRPHFFCNKRSKHLKKRTKVSERQVLATASEPLDSRLLYGLSQVYDGALDYFSDTIFDIRENNV
jgi:hypothetical protein